MDEIWSCLLVLKGFVKFSFCIKKEVNLKIMGGGSEKVMGVGSKEF